MSTLYLDPSTLCVCDFAAWFLFVFFFYHGHTFFFFNHVTELLAAFQYVAEPPPHYQKENPAFEIHVELLTCKFQEVSLQEKNGPFLVFSSYLLECKYND